MISIQVYESLNRLIHSVINKNRGQSVNSCAADPAPTSILQKSQKVKLNKRTHTQKTSIQSSPGTINCNKVESVQCSKKTQHTLMMIPVYVPEGQTEGRDVLSCFFCCCFHFRMRKGWAWLLYNACRALLCVSVHRFQHPFRYRPWASRSPDISTGPNTEIIRRI